MVHPVSHWNAGEARDVQRFCRLLEEPPDWTLFVRRVIGNLGEMTKGQSVDTIERATQAHRFTREVPMMAPLHQLLLLDTDRSGVIYLGAVVLRPGTGGEELPSIAILCLDPLDGRPLGRAALPANTDADETFRELMVLDEGGVMLLHRTEDQEWR